MQKKDFIFICLLAAAVALFLSPYLWSFKDMPGSFGDIYAYHYPLRHLVVSTLQEGRLPLWNPYIFAGTPLLANSQAALFYPASTLFFFSPLIAAFNWNWFFHFFFAGLGMFLLLRSWSIPRAGAFLLAAAYVFSPILVYRVSQGVPTLLSCLSYVPWCWLALESECALFLGAVFGLQALSGHPQFMLASLAGMALYIAVLKRFCWPFFLKSLILGAALSAAQYLPTLEFLSQSVRTKWPSVFSAAYSLHWTHLLTALNPNAMGNPINGSFYDFPSEFYEMAILYIGLIPLVLGIYGLWKAKQQGLLLAVVIAAGLFLALGTNNVIFPQITSVPPFKLMRVSARFVQIPLWGLLMAAAFGWSRLPLKATRWPLKALMVALVFADLFPWAKKFIYREPIGAYLKPRPEVVAPLQRPGFRSATSPEIPNPNKAMLYRFLNATGYEAYYLARCADYVSKSEGTPSADGSRTFISKFDSPEMSLISLRYYLSPARIKDKKALLEDPEGLAYIYENKRALPLVYFEGDAGKTDIRQQPATPEHWVVDAALSAAPKKAIFSQAFYPGWSAWVNGIKLKVELFNEFLQSVSLTDSQLSRSGAGDARTLRIHLRFFPPLWRWAIALSLAAWLLVIGALVENGRLPENLRRELFSL
ncbi:MAG: hypothetical protein A3G41_05295 [Elusimicrobia bacterium RIFCSPLOWO2_12_FULL_59_9]|nr:MAG: hypothetical protein A3G41_05295 [Elusimicrobia bacterium RIFCSPLOWO2_12_FULL_59_9]